MSEPRGIGLPILRETAQWTRRGQSMIGQFARRQPLGAISLAIILLLVLAAIFAPLLAPYDPKEQDYDQIAVGPSTSFLFGTDYLGRDMLSMMLFGGRIALIVGFTTSVVGSVVGGIVGLIGAFSGRAVDNVIQRIADVLMSFPSLILALAAVAVLGPSLFNVILAISIPIMPRAARVVRASVLSVKELPYIEAARATGAGSLRLMLVHIVPNVMAPFLIILTAQLGGAILAEASLSFLGVGVPPPNFSWGGLLAGHAGLYFETTPSTAVFPGLAIVVAVLSFSLFGDSLRDHWDPKLRGAN